MEKKTEGHKLSMEHKLVITLIFILLVIGGGLFFFAYESVRLKNELIEIEEQRSKDLKEFKEEKEKLIDTVFYIRSTTDYYVRDNERYEKFMLDGTRIILEEMEKYKKEVPSNGKMTKQEIKSYLEITYIGCNLVGIDPYLSLFQSVIESKGFNKRALGLVGELGTEQFMPLTARIIANSHSPWGELQTSNYYDDLLFNPTESKKLNIRFMKYLLEEFDGRVEWALVGYNAGPKRAKEFWNNGEAVFQEVVPQKYKNYAEAIVSQYPRLVGKNGSKTQGE